MCRKRMKFFHFLKKVLKSNLNSQEKTEDKCILNFFLVFEFYLILLKYSFVNILHRTVLVVKRHCPYQKLAWTSLIHSFKEYLENGQYLLQTLLTVNSNKFAQLKNKDLFFGLYSQKRKKTNQNPGVMHYLLPAYHQQWKTSSLDSNSSTSLPHLWREHITAPNFCPAVWIKYDLASSLFTIRDGKDLVQLNYHSILMQGPCKAKIIHSWNLK